MRMILIQYDKRYNNPQEIGGYGKLDGIDDVFCYIGRLINSFDVALTFSYLAYYNFNFNKWDVWLKNVQDNGNLICVFRSKENWYEIKLHEVK